MTVTLRTGCVSCGVTSLDVVIISPPRPTAARTRNSRRQELVCKNNFDAGNNDAKQEKRSLNESKLLQVSAVTRPHDFCSMPKSVLKELSLIKCELRPPVNSFLRRGLIFLVQYISFKDQEIQLSPHETAIAILETANNRLATHVETSVDDSWTTGLRSKGLDDLPVKGIRFTPHGLNSCRIVNMSNCGYFGSLHIQFFDTPECFFFLSHSSTP